jgi:hypothetical protein
MIRRYLFSIALAAAHFASPLLMWAQPANDDCSGAIELIPGATCSPIAGDVAGATQSTPGTVLCEGFGATPDDDVWFRFTATAAQASIVVQSSASFDAVIQLLGGPCGDTPIDCQDGDAAGAQETLNATGLSIGTEYFIRVFDWFAVPPATTTFNICVVSIAPPANDDCVGAVLLVPSPTCSPVAGNVLGATQSTPGTVQCEGFPSTPNDDVWFRFTATAATMDIVVQSSFSFDAVVQILGGACGDTPIDCQDAAAAGSQETLSATGLAIGEEYFVRVFDWFANQPATTTFSICVLGPEPSCTADAGTIAADATPVCLDAGTASISATPNGDAVVPGGFSVVYVLTAGAELLILDASATPAFTVSAAGDYTIHTLVYDPNTLDLGIVVPGATTGGDVLQYIVDNSICASLDAAGAPVVVEECGCSADAGTITADATPVCLDAGSAEVSATPNGDAVVPPGYSVAYVLTTGVELLILDASATPVFTVSATGDYTIHTLVYDPNTLDLGIVVLGVTTGADVLQYIADNSICASLDAAGAPVVVEECGCSADSGTITAENATVCLTAGMADITATHDGNSVVPVGYEQIYVLTQGAGLVIINADPIPAFTVPAVGDYTVHTLVYDPNTLDLGIVEFGVTTGFDVLQYILDNSICASLDAVGAAVTVVDCPCTADAGTITADASTVCFDLGLNQAVISATPDGNAVVPTGYETFFVLTQGAGLLIVDADATPAFTVFATGDYTIHTLVYDPSTFDLGTIELGVTTGQDVLDYITGNGLCASLDATGAPVTVQFCIICDADAGTLVIDASPVCLFMGTAQVGASHVTQPVEPDGYATAYVLTQGPGLVIVALNLGPVFTISQPGDYTVHTIVYDPNTIDPGAIELGVTTGFDINALLVQGGGTICGALDVVGAAVTVEDCSPANDDCINAAPLAINAVDDCPANAVAGDNTYADSDGGVPSCDQTGSYLFDVWYTFNAGENTEVNLALDPGTMQDWAIAIYDGCGGNELGCFLNPASPITFSTAAFTDYVVQVYSNFTNGNGGAFSICVSGAVPSVVCEGGLVQTTSGFFTVDVCQDADADVIDFTNNSSSNEQYTYLLTDDNDVIVAVLADGSLDFNSAPIGVYRVWGISHNGDLVGADPGELATAITSTGTCIAFSDNYVVVNVEICFGIEQTSVAGWGLFPNPGNGDFYIVAPTDGRTLVEVIDIGGRVAHATSELLAAGHAQAIPLGGKLAPGAYTVRLTGNGQVATLRLVVR